MRNFDPYLKDLNKRFPRRQPEPQRFRAAHVIWLLLLGILLMFIVTACFAQTVSPVIEEGKGPRVRGEVTLTNNLLQPMGLVIEPQSLSVDSAGKPLYRHLDSNISVRLDSTSARLAPKQSYVVGYEITCAVMPCVVNLSATFTGLHTKDGLAIALHLPHIVYVCAKQKGCRDSVHHSWGLK